MAKNKAVIWKNSMNYGAILGLGLVIYSVILYFLGVSDPHWSLQFVNYALIAGGIIWGTKNLRDQFQGGIISYSRCLWSGTLISFFASVILALYTYLFFTIIDTEAMDKMFIMMEEKFMQQGLPDDQVEMMVNMSKKFMTPGIMTFSILISTTIWGFVISLITSIFVKRKPSDAFSTEMEDVKETES